MSRYRGVKPTARNVSLVQQLPVKILNEIQTTLDIDGSSSSWRHFGCEIGLSSNQLLLLENRTRDSTRGPSYLMFQHWYAHMPTVRQLVQILMKLNLTKCLELLRDQDPNLQRVIDNFLEQRRKKLDVGDSPYPTLTTAEPEVHGARAVSINDHMLQHPASPSQENQNPLVPFDPFSAGCSPAVANQQAAPVVQHNVSAAPPVNRPVTANTGLIKRFECLCRFTLEEIQQSCHNRKPVLIGQSPFARIYQLTIRGTKFAFKVPYSKGMTSIVRHRIATELEALSLYRHLNIVPLSGYASILPSDLLSLGLAEAPSHDQNDPYVVLVFPVICAGSLAIRLHHNIEPLLDAINRLDILKHVANALYYIHSNTPSGYHGAVTSSNVLLDVSNAMLCGFSYSGKATSTTPEHSVTSISDKPYLGPEGLVKHPSGDIFSLGLLILETWLNKPLTSRDGEHLANSVRHENMSVPAFLYPHYQIDINTDVVNLAIKCTEPDFRHRPRIQEVHATLCAIYSKAISLAHSQAVLLNDVITYDDDQGTTAINREFDALSMK